MRYQKSKSLLWREARRDGVIVGKNVRLRGKRLSDARDDYQWQSDTELARLDAAPVLAVSFAVYLLDYTDQLHAPDSTRYPFAIETADGKHIGNCTCYDVNATKGEAQLGIIIGDRNYWDKGYGTDVITTLVSHIFLSSGLKRIHLKTLDWNLRAQWCFAKCGFVPCGRLAQDGQSFVLMELRHEQWAEQREPGEAGRDE